MSTTETIELNFGDCKGNECSDVTEYRVPGGVCHEDIDGGMLRVERPGHSEEEGNQIHVCIPILATSRALEQAQEEAKGKSFWEQLDAVKVVLGKAGLKDCSDDLADSIKFRLQAAFAKKKQQQRRDYDAIATSRRSTASGPDEDQE